MAHNDDDEGSSWFNLFFIIFALFAILMIVPRFRFMLWGCIERLILKFRYKRSSVIEPLLESHERGTEL